MIKKIATQAFLSAMFIMSVIPVTHAKEPGFKSELFNKGTLVYSDDFDGDFSKNRWGGNRGDKQAPFTLLGGEAPSPIPPTAPPSAPRKKQIPRARMTIALGFNGARSLGQR